MLRLQGCFANAICWGLGSGMVCAMENCCELSFKKRGRMCWGSEKNDIGYVPICFPCFANNTMKGGIFFG